MSDYICKKYKEFIDQHNYIPKYFAPYNAQELTDYACSIATTCGTPGHIGNILILEIKHE